jgi:hypothetical protein
VAWRASSRAPLRRWNQSVVSLMPKNEIWQVSGPRDAAQRV